LEKESKSKKSEKCLRKLKQACEKDLTNYCSTVATSELREMKKCLALNFAKLDNDCSEYIINPKGKYDSNSKGSENIDVAEPILSDPLPSDTKPVQIQEHLN